MKRFRWLSVVAGALLVLASLVPAGATQSHQLNWQYLAQPIYTLSSLAWNGSILAAVGEKGTIITSPDGENWTNQTSGTTQWLYDVASDGSQFVAVGHGGIILSSPDGETWSVQQSPTDYDLFCITWADGKFFVGAEHGLFLTSPDGIVWTEIATNAPDWTGIKAIAWNGDMFLALADHNHFTSSDGLVWEYKDHEASPWSQTLHGLATNGSMFVAVGFNGDVYTTTDGVEWQGNSPFAWRLNDVAWNGSIFAAVGLNSQVITSEEGESWNAHDTGVSHSLVRVIWAEGLNLFVTLGLENGLPVILTSPNGQDWQKQDLGNLRPIYNLVWTGSQYVAVCGWGPALASHDGITWQPQGTEYHDLYSIAWSGSRLVAVGDGILTSDDLGQNWVQRVTDEWFNGVTWTGEKFLAAGCGSIMASPDGETWQAQYEGENCLYDIIWNGSIYLAVGEGIVLISDDGETWTEHFPEIENNDGDIGIQRDNESLKPNLYSVAWDNGVFVAVGDTGNRHTGVLMTSPDGENWQQIELPEEVHSLTSVVFNGTHFAAVGYNGIVLTSYDGLEWMVEQLNPRLEFLSVIWHNPLIIGGNAGAIITLESLTLPGDEEEPGPKLPETGTPVGLAFLAGVMLLLAGGALQSKIFRG